MTSVLCRAVAQAARSAATASLDVEPAGSLLLVAGWLSTAADLVREGEPPVADLG
jgi:hypothetical protein